MFGVTYAHNPPSRITAAGNQFLYSSQSFHLPLLAIQRQWNLDMTLAPNFTAYWGGMPVAHVDNPPVAVSAAGPVQGHLSYRGSLAPRQRASSTGNNPGQILDNSLAHVSSFDLGSSTGNSR